MQCYFCPREDGHNIHNSFRKKRGAGASAQQHTVFVALVAAVPSEARAQPGLGCKRPVFAPKTGNWCADRCVKRPKTAPAQAAVGIYGSRSSDFACVSALEIWICHRNTRNPHLRMKKPSLLMGQLRIKLGSGHLIMSLLKICPGSKKLGHFFDLNSSELETSHVFWFFMLVLVTCAVIEWSTQKKAPKTGCRSRNAILRN